jgi:hypothetical protein
MSDFESLIDYQPPCDGIIMDVDVTTEDVMKAWNLLQRSCENGDLFINRGEVFLLVKGIHYKLQTVLGLIDDRLWYQLINAPHQKPDDNALLPLGDAEIWLEMELGSVRDGECD